MPRGSSRVKLIQNYIDGKFVGGSDILMDMYQSGELQKTLAGSGEK